MSKTRLSTADKNKLFFESGGLCALCRSSISYDRISRKNVRTDEYAHIIADSPDGPRGDETSRSANSGQSRRTTKRFLALDTSTVVWCVRKRAVSQ